MRPVRGLQDAFQWAFQNRERLASVNPISTDVVRHNLRNLKLSTAFAGVCAPSCALECLASAYQEGEGSGIAAYMSAIEWNPAAACELQALPKPPECRFADIMDFVGNSSLKQAIAVPCDMGDMSGTRDVLLKPGVVGLTAQCSEHGSLCTLRRATGHVAGTPCTDFSRIGAKRKDQGRTMANLFVWVHLRMLLREPWVLCENVEDFPATILESLLGALYYVSTTVVCSHDTFGLPMARKRRYTLLVLKNGCALTRPLSCVKELFGRRREDTFTWREYLVAGSGELANELAWASKRPSALGPPLPVGDPRAFLKALTRDEETTRRKYDNIAVNSVVSLNQRPDKRPSMSTSSVLHTITKNLTSCGSKS